PVELDWFEALLEEDDVDIMAWALKARPAPERYRGPLLAALEKLDYVTTEVAVRNGSPPFHPALRDPRPRRPSNFAGGFPRDSSVGWRLGRHGAIALANRPAPSRTSRGP